MEIFVSGDGDLYFLSVDGDLFLRLWIELFCLWLQVCFFVRGWKFVSL